MSNEEGFLDELQIDTDIEIFRAATVGNLSRLNEIVEYIKDFETRKNAVDKLDIKDGELLQCFGPCLYDTRIRANIC